MNKIFAVIPNKVACRAQDDTNGFNGTALWNEYYAMRYISRMYKSVEWKRKMNEKSYY